MVALKLAGFSGEQPHYLAKYLPDNAAQSAFNVRLDDGGLTPNKVSVQLAQIPLNDAKTIFQHNNEWLCWNKEIHVCAGAVASERLYYTGDGEPKLRIDGIIYPLAIQYPAEPITINIKEDTKPNDTTRNVITRAYAYTYVTEFGEESEPSPISENMQWKNGQTVLLSGFKEPERGTRIKYQRIYRVQTGTTGTDLYFIAERGITTQDFIDDIPLERFNEAIPSKSFNSPPETLKGLTQMPNGMMAAFDGRKIYFCEPWKPHAWPEKYILTTDSNIVALGAIGTVLIVLTEENPVICSGTSPEKMQMIKSESNFPCINSRAVVDMGYSIIYLSHEGIVSIGVDGSVRLISSNLFNRDAWLQMSPKTMIAAQMSGRYVAFYKTVINGENLKGAILIDASETPFLIRNSETASAAWYNINSGALCFVREGENNIYRLDSPEGAMNTLYWKSKKFSLPAPDNFGIILVESEKTLTGKEQQANEALVNKIHAENAIKYNADLIDGSINSFAINDDEINGDLLEYLPRESGTVSIGIIADGVKTDQIIKTNVPCRLKGGFLATIWEIEVSSNIPLSTIKIAKTIDELKTIS